VADEITLGYRTGATLKYAVYNPDGTEVTAPTTDLPEEGATGYFHADNGDIVAGDIVIVLEGGVTVAYGEYQPEVISSALSAELAAVDAKVDIVDANVDTLVTAQNTVRNNIGSQVEPERKPRIINI